MSPYTGGGVAIVSMLAVSALLKEWCGILAFTISLLMVFELDLHAERDTDDE